MSSLNKVRFEETRFNCFEYLMKRVEMKSCIYVNFMLFITLIKIW